MLSIKKTTYSFNFQNESYSKIIWSARRNLTGRWRIAAVQAERADEYRLVCALSDKAAARARYHHNAHRFCEHGKNLRYKPPHCCPHTFSLFLLFLSTHAHFILMLVGYANAPNARALFILLWFFFYLTSLLADATYENTKKCVYAYSWY